MTPSKSEKSGEFDVAGLLNRLRDYDICDDADIDASADYIEAINKAAMEFRDSVLHDRHQLTEEGMSSEQTNAVLDLFDDTIGRLVSFEGDSQ